MRSRRHRRRLSITLALACLLAPLFGLAHLAAGNHRTCAEHGELVETTVAVHDHALPIDSTIEAETRSENANGHEHCIYAVPVRPLIAGLHASTPARLVMAKLAASRRSVPPPVQGELYRLAPKTSPPL